jgi:transcriptional regulator with GAF, ATPase, and Fis domain
MSVAAPPTDPQSLTGVLSEIAAIASETLELQEVFGRVAAAVRQVIPFDHMGVVRIVDGDRSVKHAATFEPCPGAAAMANVDPKFPCGEPAPLTIWSERMRPRPGAIRRIDDARLELDPTFPGDAEILKNGSRSILWEPFRNTGAFSGGLWLSSFRPNAFNDEHQEHLRPIAALLGTAVEHWRIWDAERRRRDRIDRIEEPLRMLAHSLDVAEIFPRLSAEMQPILAHDLMVLTALDTRAHTIRIIAHAGTADAPVPTETVSLTTQEQERRVDVEIVHDITQEIPPNTEREKLILSSGMRSWLRVPVYFSGEVQGGLSFFHREPSKFQPEDIEIAWRLADRIALTLSLTRLAEEARIAAEARERAERLEARVETLARELESRKLSRVVGVSRSWKETLRSVGRVASSDTSVLITGESGTGKEVIANLIHQGSPRAGKPFVAINCAALPEQLLESELFGHERGAFTGAFATKIGRIEQAAGGTLFLDEITEMSPVVQAKFLRVLQEREFQRLGGSRTIRADIRVIAATNRDLMASIERQAFREDLYYRLNVFQVPITPLRERTEDILPLAEAFLEDLGHTMGRPAAGISRDARGWLLDYPWPGNVRELRNAIERAILLCDGGLITRDHLPTPPRRLPAANGSAANGVEADAFALPADGIDLAAVERGFLERALGQAKGNKTKAARLLGLTRAQLYSRLEKHGVQ